MKHLRALAASALTAVMLVAGTVTATAKPVVHEFGEFAFSFVNDECEGLELLTEGTVKEHILINGRGPDRVPHFQANISVAGSITNLATGTSVTFTNRFLDKDLNVTDNSDGTFTVIITLAGNFTLYGPDGKRLQMDAGLVVLETLWADDGDFGPSSGTRLGEELLKEVGRTDTAGRDFCADMHEFLG